MGAFPNPSLKAYGKESKDEELYRIRFSLKKVWKAAGLQYVGSDEDSVDVEVWIYILQSVYFVRACMYIIQYVIHALQLHATACMQKQNYSSL